MTIRKWLDGRMTAQNRVPALAMAIVCMAPFSAPSPAYAGFEWTPPPREAPVPVIAAPVTEVEIEENAPLPEIDPFPVQSNTRMDVSVKQQMQQMMTPVDEGETAPEAPDASEWQAATGMPENYETVVGFGSDIPLALAMRQIVPAEYSYSFGDSVNPGLRISWNGGRPWNEVLADALTPHDMHAVINEKSVWVRQGPPARPPATQITAVPEIAETVVTPIPEPVMAIAEPAPAEASEPVSAPDTASSKPVPLSAFDDAGQEEMPPQSYPRRIPMPIDRGDYFAAQDFIATDGPESTNAANTVAVAPALTPSPFAEEPPPPATPPQEVTMPQQEPAMVMMPESALKADSAPVLDPFEIRFWHAEQGDSLKNILEDWASKSGVAILWNAGRDYVLPAPVRMHGTFPDAVTHVLTSYNAAPSRPLGRLHPNLPKGPSVLVIENFSTATN